MKKVGTQLEVKSNPFQIAGFLYINQTMEFNEHFILHSVYVHRVTF